MTLENIIESICERTREIVCSSFPHSFVPDLRRIKIATSTKMRVPLRVWTYGWKSTYTKVESYPVSAWINQIMP